MDQVSAAEQVYQHTLRDSVSCVGIGLHSGERVSMTIRPAASDTGIVFVRRDVRAGRGRVQAWWGNVVDTTLCTVLGNEHGVTVSTVEHLLAALQGCSVDNAEVEVDGAEVPIVDGSAAPFVALVDQAGVVALPAKRRAIVVHRVISVRQGGRFAVLRPARRSRVSVEIDFPHAGVGRQRAGLVLASGRFREQIAPARTFGFLDEVEGLRARGLALGGSVRNAVIVDGDRIMNPEGLRFADEFARHKLLDCLGDLGLAGAPVLGHMHGFKPGHRLNHTLIRALFSETDAWTSMPQDEIPPAPRLHGLDALRRRRLTRWLSNLVA